MENLMKPMTLITATAAVFAMTAVAAKVIPNLTDPKPELVFQIGTDEHGAAQTAPHLINADADRAMVALGDLMVTNGFAFATLPNQPVGGGFVTIANQGTVDDRLISAQSPIAGKMEIHTMALDGDVMRMREVDGGLALPAGGTVELKPGGHHLMFMQITQALKAGSTVEVTLTFERAGSVTLALPIETRRPHGSNHGTH